MKRTKSLSNTTHSKQSNLNKGKCFIICFSQNPPEKKYLFI